LNGEGDFIDIYVNASDWFGNSATTVKKLILVQEAGLRIIVQKPVGRTFAFGQPVDFLVSFDSGGNP